MKDELHMKGYECNIRKVTPYVPGEQPQRKVVKLNTNENPYPPAKEVADVMMGMDAAMLRLYPDPSVRELTKALADYHKVEENQVFVGVGSDDVLAMSFLTFFQSEKPILFPDVTYSFYKVWAGLYRIPFVCVPLDDSFRIQKEGYQQENGGIIFPNPNAPTGIYEGLKFVEEMVSRNPESIVIVDEAYIDFAGESALSLLDRYENLVVVRTFSKSRSMAGMRIGYAVAHRRLIQYLNDVKHSFNSYTMNLPSIKCGTASVKNEDYFQEMIQKINTTKKWAEEEFVKLGFRCLPSGTNFLFVTHPKWEAKQLFEALKEADIYVRHWNQERILEYLRVTIGTDEEMQILFGCLKTIIGEQKHD